MAHECRNMQQTAATYLVLRFNNNICQDTRTCAQLILKGPYVRKGRNNGQGLSAEADKLGI